MMVNKYKSESMKLKMKLLNEYQLRFNLFLVIIYYIIF